jgi:ribosome-binding protein aMBF1 (putative translation factor)
MTPDRLRECIKACQWSQAQLALAARRNARTVRRWADGSTEIPPKIARWLEIIAAVHEANPPPPPERV